MRKLLTTTLLLCLSCSACTTLNIEKTEFAPDGTAKAQTTLDYGRYFSKVDSKFEKDGEDFTWDLNSDPSPFVDAFVAGVEAGVKAAGAAK